MRILITGVPGTGKTTIGDYLAKHHGFFHQNMETDDFAGQTAFKKDEANFLKKLLAHEKIVVTWGFGPYRQYNRIQMLREAGFRLFWFDGNRVASFRTFMERPDHFSDELDYYIQMQQIITTDIVEKLQPTVINPFTKAGLFRPIEEIVKEVLAASQD